MNERQAAQQGVFLCDLGNEETFDLTLMRMIRSAVTFSLSSGAKDGDIFDPESLQVLERRSSDTPPLCKMVFKTSERVRFVNELYRMNIHGASLLLGLDGFAQFIRLKLRNDIDEQYGALDWELVQPHVTAGEVHEA
jgi:hypothetical protein